MGRKSPVAVAGVLGLFAGLLARVVLLCAVCWLAVHLAVGVAAAALIQPIGDVLEGALDGGHQRLHRLQLLGGGVDGGVLGHDVAVIVAEGAEGPLQTRGEGIRAERVREKSLVFNNTLSFNPSN